MTHPATPLPPRLDAPPQRVVKVRRDYNTWVASETLEDYALRYTPERARRWSPWWVANTAFGAASFLILEAVGATLLVQYGFWNALWAIVCTGLVIALAGIPVSAYAARYGVDMDLLTRGAGFGYIGSTITSLIYASFTFIFFALEAAVMAYALELAWDIPPTWGYLICAVVVIPLVTHGVSAISALQVWTQPIWLVLLVVPFGFVLARDPQAFAGIVHYAGEKSATAGFDLHLFGAGLTVGIALITQMGEQVDYLRFMPPQRPGGKRRWWAAVLVGGPGWVVPGVLKMLGGACLAYLAISHSVPVDRAVDPNQLYLVAYEYVFASLPWAIAATALLVVVSQLKINVTNAYAGSLAWSNFFSRLTHSHPGRVVWVVFNCFIAFLLMEANVFAALGQVLGLYSNIAIAWMMAVVADLVINKPLGLSPPGIEFKRAYLYDINPVGVGAMVLASTLSIAAYLGAFGALAQAFSAVVALVTAMLASPLIAWWTKGRFYIARPARGLGTELRCVVCEREYEGPDMAHCPAYQGPICSLCCTLDARCGDMCKPHGNLWVQWDAALRSLTPRRWWPLLGQGVGPFLLLMVLTVPLLAGVFGLFYQQELSHVDPYSPWKDDITQALQSTFLKAFAALVFVAGLASWWLVLAQKSRRVAQEESNRQTHLLVQEIASHEKTDAALQAAKREAEEAREAAERANQAKSRYISAVSHELRTPLNSILGYAQLLGEDASIPTHRQQAIQVIRRGGEHLLSLIEGTLDLARIEGGKLTLQAQPLEFAPLMQELADLFALQASEKGLRFIFDAQGELPQWVKGDEKRVRQILINLLGNAIKYTRQGEVRLVVRHAREMAHVEVHDTGVGIAPEELPHIFEPFHRTVAGQQAGQMGAGMGLTICKMLTDLMGGELQVRSTLGQGTVFQARLFLPELRGAVPQATRLTSRPTGYAGDRRAVLVVDNEAADRQLLTDVLEPLGLVVHTAANGHEALHMLATGASPDAVLLDLAMPGIDGWETLRRMRALCPTLPPVAIVSANAFDRALDNGMGVTPEDFLVKPVRHSDLLDWLQRRLALQWTLQTAQPLPAAKACEPPPAPATVPIPAAELQTLADLAALGYLRGVEARLQQWQHLYPLAQAFVDRQQALARAFRFEDMQRELDLAMTGRTP
ncbi:ATP-binding protein [Curvibacter sp. APW13]|uniref:hybrid sensor histidine kinase/response regulator n=1 Tax=Curvibacter sp. APW13 TaxID=3077236 RepID=UPI0028DE340A|nr:ATP-binding protein [Curvibacter sp. APW13]MDT8990798.1 ATP-binding protein [Curvibacter sp. APW13]